MLLFILKAKLHALTVTHSNIEYEGSIGLDKRWLDKSGIKPFEKVHIYNITNGERFETYVIEEPAGSRRVVINGAAARKVSVGDRIIVACYALMDEKNVDTFRPKILIFTQGNEIKEERN